MVRVERFSLHPPFALRPPFSELFWASCPGASFLSTAVVSNPSSSTFSSGTEKSQPDKKFILIFTNFKSFAAYPNVHVNRREKIRASPSTSFIFCNPTPVNFVSSWYSDRILWKNFLVMWQWQFHIQKVLFCPTLSCLAFCFYYCVLLCGLNTYIFFFVIFWNIIVEHYRKILFIYLKWSVHQRCERLCRLSSCCDSLLMPTFQFINERWNRNILTIPKHLITVYLRMKFYTDKGT